MKLPSRIIDISMALDNDTVVDPEVMRPSIEYKTGKDNAEMVCNFFPGLKVDDLPGGEGWAWEQVSLVTHNGTHLDAPYHYHSVDRNGDPMMTIDQIPLDWCFRPGIKLDFRKLPDGHIVTARDVEAELARIGHKLKPLDIVLVNTRASECYGTPEFMTAGIGMGREATLYLTERGVRVSGIDAWGWDAPFHHMAARWAETHDPSIIWEGHFAGIDIPYCHLEKLQNLEQLPDKGFFVACFPCKITAASGAWTRAVAMIE